MFRSPTEPLDSVTRGRAQRSAPTQRICFNEESHVIRKQIQHFIKQAQHEQTRHRDARWNEERVGRKPDTPHFGGCKPVCIRRLAGRAPSKMVNSTTVSRIPKSHHRGWSTHLASRRYRLAQPDRPQNSSFVTSGGIGTHAMHPPRKRLRSESKSQPQGTSVTRGRTRRSAPTQRICFNQEASPKPNSRFAIPAEMGTLNMRTPYRQRCLSCVTPLENSHDRWRVSSQPPRG